MLSQSVREAAYVTKLWAGAGADHRTAGETHGSAHHTDHAVLTRESFDEMEASSEAFPLNPNSCLAPTSGGPWPYPETTAMGATGSQEGAGIRRGIHYCWGGVLLLGRGKDGERDVAAAAD